MMSVVAGGISTAWKRQPLLCFILIFSIRRGQCLNRHVATGIDLFAHFLAGLEVDSIFGLGNQFFARLGIVCTAGWAIMQTETAEAANFDSSPLTQDVTHVLDECIDSLCNFFLGKPGELATHSGNQF